MNEAFSDIVAAAVECLANDSKDIPDFDIGEMLGANKLRNMENPMASSSISSVCDYQSHYDVHHTSGPLSKAFVNAVRFCEQSECGDKAGCTVLLGSIFMYANIQRLTSYSGYLDGATATCSIVGEYFASKSPETSCTEASIVTFIQQGWTTVNVSLDDNCEAVTCCTEACPDVQSAPLGSTPGPTAAALPTLSPISVTTAPTSSPAAGPGPTAAALPTLSPISVTNGPTFSPTAGPGPTAAALPTLSPISVTTGPTFSPTAGPVESGEESMLFKILEFLANVLTSFNSG
jgi:Thermolysin metallopeptidase, alpha-helical domain